VTAIERTAYPRFKQSFTDQELRAFYTPTEADVTFVNKAASGPRQRLALMVLLKSFQKLGYLPRLKRVPDPIKRHITRQCADSLQPELNDLSPTTRSRYRQAIHKYLNVKPYRQGGDKVVAQVVRLSAETMSDPADLINVAIGVYYSRWGG